MGQSVPKMFRYLRWLDQKSTVTVCVMGGLVIGLIGVVSYLTGPQWSSSLFYLIPVLLVARVAGIQAGCVMAFAAAIMWLVADVNSQLQFSHPFIPYWNALMRLGTFMVAVSLVSAMRSLNANLEDRVIERTSALESQMAENRQLEKTILEISDREQVKIGQDLHDGLCQHLVSAAFSANLLQDKLTKESPGTINDAIRIADMIDEAISQARNLARGLYPVRLETDGLETALRELASTLSRRFEVECCVDCPVPVTVNKAGASIHLYRIAQEAITNAAKHADAGHIILTLSPAENRLTMTIRDDGLGIGLTNHKPDGMGLRIMKYRARLIGGDFQVNSVPAGGTQVICAIEN